jgi:hypothetical protein
MHDSANDGQHHEAKVAQQGRSRVAHWWQCRDRVDRGAHSRRAKDHVRNPSGIEAHATLEFPGTGNQPAASSVEERGQLDKDWGRHDAGVLAVLSEHSQPQPWWLGYLETGASDLIFDGARRVRFYAGWPYVLIEAGLEQAGI